MIVLSPFYVIYSGQAMTEIPSLLVLAAGLVLHTRGVRTKRVSLVLLGALLLGAGVNIRELAALYAPWLLLAPLAYGWTWSRRNTFITLLACVIFCVAAFAPFATWYLFDIQNYQAWWHGWVASTRAETARHPVMLANFRPLFLYFFIAAPITLPLLPFAVVGEWRRRRRAQASLLERAPQRVHHRGTEDAEAAQRFFLRPSFFIRLSPALALGLLGAAANLSLIIHYSVVLNGRYMLTGLPAITPLVAVFLIRLRTRWTPDARSAFIASMLLVVSFTTLVGIVVYRQAAPTIGSHALTGTYIERLRLLPTDAIILAGGQTVGVNYWRGIGAGQWETIGIGGGYYGEQWLNETINYHLQKDRRVFLDTDPQLWARRGWQLEETRAIVRLDRRFRFRRISDTIYELRLPTDANAADDAQLDRLLPENGC